MRRIAPSWPTPTRSRSRSRAKPRRRRSAIESRRRVARDAAAEPRLRHRGARAPGLHRPLRRLPQARPRRSRPGGPEHQPESAAPLVRPRPRGCRRVPGRALGRRQLGGGEGSLSCRRARRARRAGGPRDPDPTGAAHRGARRDGDGEDRKADGGATGDRARRAQDPRLRRQRGGGAGSSRLPARPSAASTSCRPSWWRSRAATATSARSRWRFAGRPRWCPPATAAWRLSRTRSPRKGSAGRDSRSAVTGLSICNGRTPDVVFCNGRTCITPEFYRQLPSRKQGIHIA